MSYHKINITLTFNDIEELEEFTKDYRCMIRKRALKLFKSDDERRGSGTKQLHQQAKEYQKEHPETPYKECLKVVGNQLKLKNKDIIYTV